jgi:hypothetical protein
MSFNLNHHGISEFQSREAGYHGELSISMTLVTLAARRSEAFRETKRVFGLLRSPPRIVLATAFAVEVLRWVQLRECAGT